MEATQQLKDVVQNDDLQAEYDIKSLRVRKVGPGRTSFAGRTAVTLAPDVAAIFGSEEAVNEALRALIKTMNGSTSSISGTINP